MIPPSLLASISLASFFSLLVIACGPSSDESRYDPALDNLRIEEINPGTVLLGSRLVVRGQSFVGMPWGAPSIIVSGQFESGESSHTVEFRRPMNFVDLQTLETTVDLELLEAFGGVSGVFQGTISVLVDSSVDGEEHFSAPLTTTLQFREQLTPSLGSLQKNGPIFINEELEIQGQGFLLGGEEGATYAQIAGCFTANFSGTCVPLESTELLLENSAPEASDFDRTITTFVYSPQISGISRGEFVGTITLINRHHDGTEQSSDASNLQYEIREPELFSTFPLDVSVGKYLYLSGGGFIQTGDGASSLLELSATYTPEGGRPESIDLLLVPEFIAGKTLRYTINEDDALGQVLALRSAQGSITGDIRLLIQYGEESITSRSIPVSIAISPVKQIVYLEFTKQYLDALRSFGLRAMDANIRERVIANIEHSFRNINLELRSVPPDDFSLYSTVQIAGSDPNGLGLLGYDNTPGKDAGNLRLHDNIGGVNAETQEDGFPGYGGVFIESLFLFSKHPGEFAKTSNLSDPLFDEIFDPFRPDRGGKPVRAADLAAGVMPVSDPLACPSTTRPEQIACAAWTLSNLIGSTISHELGHSLGLANPDGSNSHHRSDGPNRLMDSGNGRPFDERAELRGRGPAVFCNEAYEYLRGILQAPATSDYQRPSCQ